MFFQDATLANEGQFSTIESTLPTMDFLLEKLEYAKVQYANDLYISPCCNASWAKLDKYYSLTERSPVYTVALVLCPYWKWTYFESNWPLEWVEKAHFQVQDFWKSQYKPISVPELANQEATTSTNHFLQWRATKQGSTLGKDEYQHYIQSPTITTSNIDPRSWWREPTQRRTYPNLSVMALDILSIPAMSAEPERLFSSAKITISDRRASLGIQSIEAIECLKSWLKKDSINWVDIRLE